MYIMYIGPQHTHDMGRRGQSVNRTSKAWQFSVPQIEYTLGGTSKMGSHIYFLLIVAMVLLLLRHIVLLWRQDNISIKQWYNLTKQ